MTSPMQSSGTAISIAMIGSSRIGLALREGGLEAHRGGDLERHFRRVDVVVRAVVERHPHVDDRVAGEDALGQRLAHALLDRRNELPRHDAADDLVDELEAGAARQRLHLEPGVAELAAAAGLLLELALRLGACP